MNKEFSFNVEYLEECAKRIKKPEERKYPKKDWPVGYEPTKKEFEEWMEEGTGIPVSFHWEDIGGGSKRGVFTPIIKEEKKIVDKANDGTIGEERMYIKSENQAQVITLENKKGNSSQIQQDTDKEVESTKTEIFSISDKKEQKTEKENNQQDFSQKTDKQEEIEIKERERNLASNQQSSSQNNKETNQNIYYGVGLVSLVLLLITMVVVRMNKKR